MKKKILLATVLLAFGMSACGNTTIGLETPETTPAPTTVSAEPTQAESAQVDTEAEKMETVPEETEEHVRTPEQEHIAELLYGEIPTANVVQMTIIYDGEEYPIFGSSGFWDETNNFLCLLYPSYDEGGISLGYVKYGDKEYFGVDDGYYEPLPGHYATDPNAMVYYQTITDFKTGDVINISERPITGRYENPYSYDYGIEYSINGEKFFASRSDVLSVDMSRINSIDILEEKGIEVIYDRDKMFGEQLPVVPAVAVPAN